MKSTPIPAEPAGGYPIVLAAVRLICEAEGCKLSAYLCPAGVWTIGYGTTGKDIVPGLIWSQAQADRAFWAAVRGIKAAVLEACRKAPTPNQLGAMVSLTYNIGAAGFRSSTLLKEHNQGHHSKAAAEFHRWNKARDASGKLAPLAGLTVRRAAESALYLEHQE